MIRDRAEKVLQRKVCNTEDVAETVDTKELWKKLENEIDAGGEKKTIRVGWVAAASLVLMFLSITAFWMKDYYKRQGAITITTQHHPVALSGQPHIAPIPDDTDEVYAKIMQAGNVTGNYEDFEYGTINSGAAAPSMYCLYENIQTPVQQFNEKEKRIVY